MDIKRFRELSGQRGLFETDAPLPELPVGKHNHVSDDEFDAEQLAMGIAVEMEHTDDPAIAKAIAKDHLSELTDYYTRLAAMVEVDDDADDEAEKDVETSAPADVDVDSAPEAQDTI